MRLSVVLSSGRVQESGLDRCFLAQVWFGFGTWARGRGRSAQAAGQLVRMEWVGMGGED